MEIIFIHQNFPAQYVHIARHLAEDPKNKVYFITQTDNGEISSIRKLIYKPELPAISTCHSYTAPVDAAVRTGAAVASVCRNLRDAGVRPDILVGHCGWGETLFVKDAFPNTPLLSYFEFFYHPAGADVGFDSEFGRASADDGCRLQVRNVVNRLSFASSAWGHTATAWQRSLFPAHMQARITRLHEGVDTNRVRPDEDAWIRLAREDLHLSRQNSVLTYVSRNLEPYRGFHLFMRALPKILRRYPDLHVVIVGGDGLSYSPPPPFGGTYREMLLHLTGPELDLGRIHFLGQVPYETYVNVLQISSVHVHLTYPFVLSWSLIEAMSAGCAIVGSATAPVLEVLRDGENGLTAEFFSTEAICERVCELLEDRELAESLGASARATAVAEFDLETVTLPRWNHLLETLASGAFPDAEPVVEGPGKDTN